MLSIGKTVNLLTDTYCGALREGLPFRELPSVMLWGPPGVGKSQAVRQIGSEIAGRTGRKVQITDVRLLLFNPIDLRGIPTANADKTLAVWLKPQIFQMDDSPEVVNMVCLTDGCCDFPDESITLGVPFLWMLLEGNGCLNAQGNGYLNADCGIESEIVPPWGKVARITLK